jgi:hypothetical protein
MWGEGRIINHCDINYIVDFDGFNYLFYSMENSLNHFTIGNASKL